MKKWVAAVAMSFRREVGVGVGVVVGFSEDGDGGSSFVEVEEEVVVCVGDSDSVAVVVVAVEFPGATPSMGCMWPSMKRYPGRRRRRRRSMGYVCQGYRCIRNVVWLLLV